jgi:hypothetical protein
MKNMIFLRPWINNCILSHRPLPQIGERGKVRGNSVKFKNVFRKIEG